MSFREALGPELPYLRRYARAITGSQALGDAAVREMLEALVEAPGEFDEARPPRLELYRIFHHLWRPDVFAELSSEAPTSALSLRSRQSLLLTAVEIETKAVLSRMQTPTGPQKTPERPCRIPVLRAMLGASYVPVPPLTVDRV